MNAQGLLGIATLLFLAWAISRDRKAINWRTVGGAFAIQLGIGAFVLIVPWGVTFLARVSDFVAAIIGAGNQGIGFIFGPTVDEKFGFVFAFKVLPVIVFFSSLIAVLYYLGVMRWVIAILGGALQRLLKTSRAESLSATANIFVGQTEAPLVVKPYIPRMTQSELFAVMVGGLASIAGSVLAALAGMGIELKYLIAACFMSAPGGLLFAKLILPETEKPALTPPPLDEEDKPVNLFDAAAKGAAEGLQLALNVGAMLLAFIGLIAVLNLGLEALGTSLEKILGFLFAPLAWLVGIPWTEAAQGGSLIGQKVVANEFVAFFSLQSDFSELSERTKGIITFALCGFANFSSIAILLGGLGGMAPGRRPDIARLGLLAVLAATFSNLMSASIAGLFL
ncbi:MAG: NupC/NupG family nucleoside CNT transporter [Verrucomicrobiota bacterium JB023]|nr:NupC/NupG family nucleoside CNT transporter [Verrucomicrobiota bacterium JB023]